MKKFLLSKIYMLFVMLFPLAILAQGTITGTVTEASTNNPLPGVSIIIQGTSTGTTSDFDGNFSISASDGDVLVFSYVGFDAQEVTVSGSTVNVTMQAGVALDQIVLLGSRNTGRTIIDTPVPVDVINVAELAAIGPQTTLSEILNYVAPSFTANAQTVADGTDHVVPASLRGLGIDQVLVLVNGKRRHKSSLLNLSSGTIAVGLVGTDMNSIPAAAIDRIEVLRDGAAAQYGSDAIAGVINLVLKKATNKLTLNVNTGANISQHSEKYDDGGVDGEKFQIDANYGLDLGKNGGYINFTGSLENRDATNRSDSMGQPIYTMFDIATRTLGYDQAFAMDPSALSLYVAGLDPSLQAIYDAGIANGDSFLDIIKSNGNNGAVSEFELAARGLDRDDFRMKVGQSELRDGKFMMNMEIPVDENGSTFYAFGGLAFRDGLAAGFHRRPAYTDGRGNTAATPNGFLPHIASIVVDKSFGAGIKGKLSNWDVDFSNTYGTNSFDFTIKNTANATLGASTPSEFEAGGFSFAQNTSNLDLSNFYDDIFDGFNVAFGAEYRVENYQLIAGEEASYTAYDINGEPVTQTTPASDKVYSYFGSLVNGGSQVFSGFRPANEADQNRNSYAGYVDLEADLSEEFLLSAAIRYEDYSDFGDTFNWKVASRFKVSDNFAIRAAVSTGFRAPDLHQIYFNTTSTQFIGGVPIEVGLFANNSRLAQLVGIPSLKEETSRNFSVGFTAKIPDAGIKITIDGYSVKVEDRIGLTKLYSPDTPEEQAIFDAAAAGQTQFLTNGFGVDTKGLDIVIDHRTGLGEGTLNNTLSGTFRDIEVVDVISILGEEILEPRNIGFVEDAMPSVKINLSHTYDVGNWNFLLRNVYFGAVNDPDFKPTDEEYGAKIITDLAGTYTLSDDLRITVGANNLLDVYPDEVPTGGNYGGQFRFSRRVSQFGFNGRYVYGRLTFTLK